MVAEVGPLGTARVEPAITIRPTVAGKAPHKKFQKKGLMKRPQKYWAGTVAVHEIYQYQMSTKFLICKCPFMRLVCEIAQDCGWYDLCFQVPAVMALQEAAEYYLTGLLEDANLCTIHMKFITIMSKDIQLACHICREHFITERILLPKSALGFCWL